MICFYYTTDYNKCQVKYDKIIVLWCFKWFWSDSNWHIAPYKRVSLTSWIQNHRAESEPRTHTTSLQGRQTSQLNLISAKVLMGVFETPNWIFWVFKVCQIALTLAFSATIGNRNQTFCSSDRCTNYSYGSGKEHEPSLELGYLTYEIKVLANYTRFVQVPRMSFDLMCLTWEASILSKLDERGKSPNEEPRTLMLNILNIQGLLFAVTLGRERLGNFAIPSVGWKPNILLLNYRRICVTRARFRICIEVLPVPRVCSD